MSDDKSSSSTLITFSAAGMIGPKAILGTTVKLNESNYLLWAQAFCIFIGAQNKLAHLFDTPHVTTNLTYVTLLT